MNYLIGKDKKNHRGPAMKTTNPRLKKILQTPPHQLADIEKLMLECNTFFQKAYCIRWNVKAPNRPHLDYTFDRGGHIMN